MTGERTQRRLAPSEGWLTAFAPATVANFGSGFDAFAAALAIVARDRGGRERLLPAGDLVSVRRTKRKGVRIVGITGDGGRLPRSAGRNCAAVAAGAVLRRARAPFGLDVIVAKGLPLSSGLGSSAASAAAGAYAAAMALRRKERRRRSGRAASEGSVRSPDKKALLPHALAGEHVADGSWHGDNVFASLMGGGIIVLSTRGCEIAAVPAHRSLRWIVVHPDLEVTTRRARAVLPARVPLGDATRQAALFASMVAAWSRGDRAAIGRGLEDQLATPRRRRLLPGYEAARSAALRAGAYGFTFAGAGPSVLAIAPEGEETRVGEAIRAAFGRSGLSSTLLVCAVDSEGARRWNGGALPTVGTAVGGSR